jgi:hypothetical protein
MKMKHLILIIIVITIQLFPQGNFNLELQKFLVRGGNYTQLNNNQYIFEYKDGSNKLFNFNKSNFNKIKGAKNIIIDVDTINMNLYDYKFQFWQSIPISTFAFYPLFVADINHNGRPEIYGHEIPPPSKIVAGPIVVYELDHQKKYYNKVYSFSDSNTVFVKGFGKIHQDSTYDIYISYNSNNNGLFYKSINNNTFTNTYDFELNLGYYPNQINDMTLGDFDKDGTTDFAFIDGNTPCHTYIATYNDSLKNISVLYEDLLYSGASEGFCIDDFDNDGKTEVIYGTTSGDVDVIKSLGSKKYELVWTGNCGILNAYMHAVTNDLDGNGKKEFWIGGQDFVQGITKLICYEASDSNGYEQVATIQFNMNSIMLDYLQAADIDGDGKDELIFQEGNVIIVLKFTGSTNNPDYSIFYAKINELTQIGADFGAVSIFDLNLDGKPDILLPMDNYFGQKSHYYAYMLTNQNIDYVQKEDLLAKEYQLFQNYPNPFNPSTDISYSLPTRQIITVKVYDILGKEITTLVNEEKPAGRYTVSFNPRNLSSGIYFYTFRAGGFSQTKKMIFLK